MPHPHWEYGAINVCIDQSAFGGWCEQYLPWLFPGIQLWLGPPGAWDQWFIVIFYTQVWNLTHTHCNFLEDLSNKQTLIENRDKKMTCCERSTARLTSAVATDGWLAPKAFSRISTACLYSGSALSYLPWRQKQHVKICFYILVITLKTEREQRTTCYHKFLCNNILVYLHVVIYLCVIKYLQEICCHLIN